MDPLTIQNSPLVNLPRELRTNVFKWLFAEAELCFSSSARPPTLRNGHRQILLTCQTVQEQASDILHDSLLLTLYNDAPCTTWPRKLLERVRRINSYCVEHRHVDFKRFPALQVLELRMGLLGTSHDRFPMWKFDQAKLLSWARSNVVERKERAAVLRELLEDRSRGFRLVVEFEIAIMETLPSTRYEGSAITLRYDHDSGEVLHCGLWQNQKPFVPSTT